MKRVGDIIREHRENIDNIQCELLSYRCYGDAKISKPKVLKGLKPVTSFDLLKKKVNVYDLGNGELVLHFGTLFSKYASFPDKEDMQLPASALAKKYGLNRKMGNKFVYPDAWCTIYNRNEGYILVKGLKSCFTELYGIHLSLISEKLYSCIRELSTKDSRFMTLGLVPTSCDCSQYARLCDDLVQYLYKEERK